MLEGQAHGTINGSVAIFGKCNQGIGFCMTFKTPKSIHNFAKQLSSSGYSVTKARMLVFELMINQEPQSISEIIQRASGQVDRASIYRIIRLFEKLGIVQRLYIGWKYKIELTDKYLHHHHHISCLKCGRVISIHDVPTIKNFIKGIASEHGFKPVNHQFEISGYCNKCAKSQSL